MSVRPARARRCKTWAATLACCILAGAVGLMCRRAAVHPLLASLPGGAAPAAAECELEGTAYDCSSLFDWRWYVEHHADLAGLTAAQALEHWAVHGAAEGRRSHRGPAVLKLVRRDGGQRCVASCYGMPARARCPTLRRRRLRRQRRGRAARF